ncbi:bidirectional sugar transporter SWEET3b-like [Cryptomeria japonica]|uniref:bidirectional sugar transporter SWEET3b-like n=1 Tax=Cryptomeria japonica TaxID=3369 RepID=UPI0027DA1E08|nr:bidirectional sugar transporter SWEET3b-like [Cryptomeria japonica]
MNAFIRCGAGSAFALLMYGAPISNFRRVVKKKTTGEMSGMSYAIGLFNCLIYTLYGSPLISNGWENALLMGTNALGFLLQFCFCTIYFIFAPPKSKRTMSFMVGGVLVVFASTAAISMWGVEAGHKKMLVGTTGMVATVILVGSPLSNIKVVIRSKSVDCMSIYFSIFSFLGCLLWLVYGALSRDILIMAPNFLGVPLASVQIIIYCTYSQMNRVKVEDARLKKLAAQSEKMAVENCLQFALCQPDVEIQLK